MWGIGYLGDGRVEKINGRLRLPRDLPGQKVTATSELEEQRGRLCCWSPEAGVPDGHRNHV